MDYTTCLPHAPARTHTVYTIPRDLTWHATQRMPAVIETALQSKISELCMLFCEAGLYFDPLVSLTFCPDEMGARVTCDFSHVAVEPLKQLVFQLAKRFEHDLKVANYLVAEDADRGALEYHIQSLIQQQLVLLKPHYQRLLRKQEDIARREIPPHLLATAARKNDRSDWVSELEVGEGALPLGGPTDHHGIDELIADVFAKAPWMDAPLRRIWDLMKTSSEGGLGFPPILLHGPGGTGKSMLARLISEASGVACHEMDGSAGAAAFRVAGLEAGWAGSRLGEPLRFIGAQRCPNPIMVINELDKATGGARSDKGAESSLINALLPLLDPHSAASWRCPVSGMVCDMSRINWVFTANQLDGLSQPFLSRLEVIHVPALTEVQYMQAVEVMCPNDELVRETARRFVQEEWRRPQFSLRLLSRTIKRLSADQRPEFH
ncbi:hypothetical protein BVC71_02865 [Marivivens niveibacter]|uniref:AAA+ ATPase domain-containing protein n=1 Tax=Marivivens niveibacter TaxID=1930667 RepID=A0A251X1I3_9RHOB|nr:AAA family ATPase [Marivivens niveibacter]OUD10456.1 hypothetical protein BVC71_02865 [Marivivens niveibacter]